MSDSKGRIAAIRAALESADADLVRALEARARAVRDYIALRDADPSGFFALPSGAEVVARARELRKDFPANGLESVLREVLSVCTEMVAPATVAVLGPEGGFAHGAGRKLFGSRATFEPFGTVADVFAAIERSATSYGVVPLENSTDGALSATLSGLAVGNARITSELTIDGAYHLYSRTGNAADVEKVYGAGSAFAACARALKADYARATHLDVRSGMVAAQLAKDDHGGAALGPELLGELEGLRIVRRNLEDEPVRIRFVVLGREAPRRTGHDRSVLALSLSEAPGSLYAALQPFAERGINLTRLESRRVTGGTELELFFVELDGHVSDRPVLTAIEEVKAKSRHVRVLGSYPRPQGE
jgi:chorismate mutase/prephenate dehydratase